MNSQSQYCQGFSWDSVNKLDADGMETFLSLMLKSFLQQNQQLMYL